MGTITLSPARDFAISFWFTGMPYPALNQKHVLLQLSTDNGESFMRFEQSGRHPSGVTTFLTIDNQLALHAPSRNVFADSIFSAATSAVVVGEWNHFLLNVKTSEKTARICLKSKCFTMEDGMQAPDGNTYNVAGVGANTLVLSSHINGEVNVYCPRDVSGDYACYEGQLDEIRVYRRALSDIDMTTLSTPELSGFSETRRIADWQKPAYIPWNGENLVLQHRILNVPGRYIFLKSPVCDQARSACNTQHTIPIVQAYVDWQKWHFATSSTWSWSGDRVPDISTQEPWVGGLGLCFQYDTGLFSHRQFLGLAPFAIGMDLQNVKSVSGFVFTYVGNSSQIGSVRI